ncbi:uncharacterized protein LOC144159639 isoform X2 [Haemaphysalis longicornis]
MAEPGDWELSKENIQPLRQGRTMSSLQTALAPQCQQDLKKKRREFEEQLRTTSGADLLDVWHRYILWVEQHYPSGGHEVNIVKLMEQAMAHFAKADEFHNDERYVGIWIRYALKCQHPIEVCKTMYSSNIGTSHAAFFLAFANHLEAAGDVRRASRILRVGIDKKAQPVEELERALRHLEARVGMNVAQQVREEKPFGEEEEARATLAPLGTQGKRGVATIARTGAVARPAEPRQGGLAMVSAGSAAGNRGHTKVRVRSDENDENAVFLEQPAAAAPSVLPAAQSAKENCVAPGKWAGAKAKQRLPVAPTQSKFEIPEDTELPPLPCTPVVIPGSRQALSVRKEPEQEPDCWDTWVVPVMRPDPPGLKTRPMYDKASVYRGTTEFQFEELRMAAYYCGGDGRAQPAETSRVQQLEDEVQQLRRELRELRSLLAATRPSGQDEAAVKNRIGFLEQSILETERSRLAAGLATENGQDSDAGEEEEKKEDDTPGSPTGTVGNGVVTPSSAHSSHRSTADVSHVVRSLWNGTLGQSGVEPPTSPTQPPSCTGAAPDTERTDETGAGAEQCAGDPVAAPFQVFTEPTVTGAVFPARGSPMGPPMEEGDENRPPTSYSQPPLPRNQAEGLQYRVPFAELEPEPMPDDEDAEDGVEDDEDGVQGVEPLAEDTNFTYAPSKSFVRKVTSTPLTAGVPLVGEDFTVGGLTAMVQAVAIAGAPDDTQGEQQPPVAPQPLLDQQQPEGAPSASAAAPVEDPAVLAAKRRFSVAAPGDLSTIFECSKEGKSSGSSSSSGASSAHSVGATLSRGVSGMLPTVQEEEHPQQPPSAVQQGEEGYQEEEYQEGCREEQEEEAAGDEEEEMVEEAEWEEQGRGGFSVDPFSDGVRSRILRSWQVSESDRGRFHQLNGNRPALKADAHITLGGQQLRVVRHLAAGSYARVYLAETVNTEETFLDDAPDESFQAPVQTQVVLKLDAHSSSGLWEFYVTTELARRLREAYSNERAVNSIADLLLGCFYRNSSILVFPFSCYGTLLDLVSRYRSGGKGSGVPECLVLYLALELITAVDQVHTCGVIHADIKPDNVLVQDLPSEAGFLDRFGEAGVNCIRLIDFGRAIDMTALPEGTTFNRVIETDGFQSTEMLSGRPWTFQVDWFGVLGCLHVLLFGEYMAVEQLPDGRWAPRLRFKRYWQQDLWTRLFSELLNIPSCAEQPDVTPFVLEIKNLLLKRSRAHDVVMEALRAKNL